METILFNTLREHEKECTAINFNENASHIQWQKDGTDFLLNGEEYDVVKTKMINGSIYLLVITDKEEAQRLSDISLSYAVEHSGGVDYQLIFSDDYVLDEISYPAIRFYSNQSLTMINNSLKDVTRDILLPPPQAFLSVV